MKQKVLIEIVSMLLVTLFLYAGIVKLMDYNVFKEQIAISPLLKPFTTVLTWFVPCLEFFVSLLLIIPRYRLRGLWSSLILMTMFTIYLIVISSINEDIPCRCGGAIEELTLKQHIIFNIMMIILTGIGIFLQSLLSKRNINERKQLNMIFK